MKKNILKRRKKAEQKHDRITNETVAEHREKILAGGRKFKYPHQYLRHKLVINTIIISVLSILLLIGIFWWALYKAQDTGEFTYRVTRVVPAPVAKVSDEYALYSDYLMRFRGTEKWLSDSGQIGSSDQDDKTQLDFYKKSILDGLIEDVYAQKLAKEIGVSVSGEDIDQVIDATRKVSSGEISKEVYDASTESTLGYSPSEYRRILELSLLRQKVAYEIDDEAAATTELVAEAIGSAKGQKNLSKIATALQKSMDSKLDFGSSGLVSKNNKDGGLTVAALTLETGEISDSLKSTNGDGYYFVQRLQGRDGKVSYQYIRVPLTEFKNRYKNVIDTDEIERYISL